MTSFLDDPLMEEKFTKMKGLVYKYPGRILLELNNICSVYCQFCTRKRETFKKEKWELNQIEIKKILDFINEKFIQELYPFQLRTMVYPGIIFQSTSGYYVDYNNWKVQLVTDFWAKMQESFGTICIPPGTPPLAVECAKRPGAYQSRIGGSVAYSLPGVSSSWTMSLYIDKTYWSHAIGKDLNIVFNVECNF